MATYKRSAAQIGGHPVHPMFVPFPIAFWLAALACDVVYAAGGSAGWSTAALWLVGAGLVFALVAGRVRVHRLLRRSGHPEPSASGAHRSS